MEKKALKTKIRPFTLKDAQKVVDIINAYSQASYGLKDTDLDESLSEWTSPGFIPEEMARVIEDEHGNIIGYVDVFDIMKPHVIKYVWGVMHPDHWDEQLYLNLLAWAEGYTRNRIDLVPEGARVVIQNGLRSKDHQRSAALLAYGYKPVRNYYRMVIELDREPEQPAVINGIQIVPIHIESELEKALIAGQDGFRDHWGFVEHPTDKLMEQWEHYIETSKDFDPSLWFLAKDGDQIAGICRNHGKMTEDPDMGWVSELSVRKLWRKQGLGKALLLTSFNEFYRRGKKRVGLGVDATSLTNATRLYESVGMHISESSINYEYELRPGNDLTTTTLS
ncbi:MAG: GNAT family N-acetyltransferase [Brevefilum sp.]|jgi:mycothiol synthase